MDAALNPSVDLVCELMRATNEVKKLDAYDMAHILERSLIALREMREVHRIRVKRYTKDPLIDLEKAQSQVMRGIVDSDRFAAALLQAADMIRELHIASDTGRK